MKKTRIAYENPWIRVREDNVVRPDGSDGLYGVVETGGASFIIALDDENRVLLVNLNRHTTGPSLEIPAGGLDGEDPLAAAQRELLEETGYAAKRWDQLASLDGLNGVARAKHHFYLARELTKESDRDDHKRLEGIEALERIPLDDALRMCNSGEIGDVDTVAGLGLARDYIRGRSGATDRARAATPPAAPRKKYPWHQREIVQQYGSAAIAGVMALGLTWWSGLLLTSGDGIFPALTNSFLPALLFYGFWGVLYFLFTLFAYRKPRGDALRDKILGTRPEKSFWSSASGWASVIVGIALFGIIGLLLAGGVRDSLPMQLGAAGSLAGAWLLLMAVFALEYTRLWAADAGIRFPQDPSRPEERRFRDFLYLSAQVNTTFGPGDVQFTSAEARKSITAQSIVAFLFNTVVIALLIALLV